VEYLRYFGLAKIGLLNISIIQTKSIVMDTFIFRYNYRYISHGSEYFRNGKQRQVKLFKAARKCHNLTILPGAFHFLV